MHTTILQTSGHISLWVNALVRSGLRALRLWWRARTMAAGLHALDNRTLKDIGVHRCAIAYIARERASSLEGP